MSEPLLYALLFAGSLCIYLPIYRFAVARWSSEYVIRAIEKGDIQLNYLLEKGGVFDELAERVVKRFKHNALAELGQMTYQTGAGAAEGGDAQLMGLEAAGQLLQMVGMKKPPAMLQYKVAEALGQLMAQHTPVDEFEQFKS